MKVNLIYNNKNLFRFDIEDNLQLLGSNLSLKNKITILMDKVISNYRFKDFELEYMDGNYPRLEVTDGEFSKSNYEIIVVNSIENLIDHLVKKKNSIFEKYIISLEENLKVSSIIYKIEDSILKLSTEIEDIIIKELDLNNIKLSLDLDNLTLKKIYRSFFKVNYYNNKDKRKGPWQLTSIELIELFTSFLEKLIQDNKNYILILNQLDVMLDNYDFLIDLLINLSEKNHNFTFWNIPAYNFNIIKNKEYFDKTYICYSEDIIKLENFDLTYESICRNYPSNNYPTEKDVLNSLLLGLNKYRNDISLNPSKKNIILSIFLDLLDLDYSFKNIKKLDNLENKYLEINI